MGELITIGKIESKIFQIRGRRAILDEDLAMLYGVRSYEQKEEVGQEEKELLLTLT